MKITIEFDSIKELREFVKNEYPHMHGIKKGAPIVGSSLDLILQKKLSDIGFCSMEEVLSCTDDRLQAMGLDPEPIRAWTRSV